MSEDDLTGRNMYTQMHKRHPAINKQKFTNTPQVTRRGSDRRGRVEAEFVHCYKYSVVDLRLLCVSEWMLHWFTQYIRHCLHFNQNTVSK